MFMLAVSCYCQVLKLYAWEPSFREKIREVRLKEIAVLLKLAIINMLMSVCWDMAPYLVSKELI
jgi:hypothetical protein